MPKLDKVADKADSKSTKKQEKQEEVQEQDTKEDTKEDTKKVMNRDTTKVGLNFNVKKFKDWLKKHYNQVHDVDNIKIMNAHYMMSAIDEIVLFTILTNVSHQFSKEKTGLQDITLERLRSFIQTTDYMNETYGRFFSKYDANNDYAQLLCMDRTKFDDYVLKYCFHNNNTIHINKDTRNFLCFLLVQTNITLANTAFMISKYFKKSTINVPSLYTGVELFFSGKLQQDILKKLEEITTILKNKLKQDSDKAEDDKSKSKEATKKNDDESDEDDEEEEEEEEEEESEEESEEEEKVVDPPLSSP